MFFTQFSLFSELYLVLIDQDGSYFSRCAHQRSGGPDLRANSRTPWNARHFCQAVDQRETSARDQGLESTFVIRLSYRFKFLLHFYVN